MARSEIGLPDEAPTNPGRRTLLLLALAAIAGYVANINDGGEEERPTKAEEVMKLVRKYIKTDYHPLLTPENSSIKGYEGGREPNDQVWLWVIRANKNRHPVNKEMPIPVYTYYEEDGRLSYFRMNIDLARTVGTGLTPNAVFNIPPDLRWQGDTAEFQSLQRDRIRITSGSQFVNLELLKPFYSGSRR